MGKRPTAEFDPANGASVVLDGEIRGERRPDTIQSVIPCRRDCPRVGQAHIIAPSGRPS